MQTYIAFLSSNRIHPGSKLKLGICAYRINIDNVIKSV